MGIRTNVRSELRQVLAAHVEQKSTIYEPQREAHFNAVGYPVANIKQSKSRLKQRDFPILRWWRF